MYFKWPLSVQNEKQLKLPLRANLQKFAIIEQVNSKAPNYGFSETTTRSGLVCSFGFTRMIHLYSTVNFKNIYVENGEGIDIFKEYYIYIANYQTICCFFSNSPKINTRSS